MADATILALQTGINRFATAGAFAPVATDGVIGPKTFAGVLNALGFLTKISTYSVTATGLIAQIQAGGQAQVVASASGLQQYLNGCANELGLKAPVPAQVNVATAPPAPYPGAAAGAINTSLPFSPGAMSASILGVKVPKLALYVGGGALALFVVYLIAQRKPATPSY